MPGNSLARPEQTESAQVIDFQAKRKIALSKNAHKLIINRALTAAALAPTAYDALDICGRAFYELTELAIATEGPRHAR